ncbi:MAG: PAS domain S-box protein [Candidatus Micrarchaeota archaeon]
MGFARVPEAESLMPRNARLAELLPEPVLEMDAAGTITYANSAAFAAFGYHPADFMAGMSPLMLIIPEERERAAADMKALLLGHKVEGAEYTGLRRDGTTFSLSVHAAPIFNGGRIDGAGGIAIDVSRRKDAERRLGEIRERYDALYERSQEGVFVLGFGGEFLDANPAMEGMLGYARGEILEMNFAELVFREDLPEAIKALRELRSGGMSTGLRQFRFRKKGGAEAILSLSGFVTSGSEFMCIARDVTERHRMRQELERARLREAAYTAVAEGAHEMKNRVQAMDLHLRFLKRAVEGQDGAAALEGLERASGELERTKRMLKNLMALGSRGISEPREFALKKVMGDLAIYIGTLKSSLPHPLEARMDFEEGIVVSGDPDQLHIALSNIALNAVQAMPEGGTLEVRASLADGYARITVSDTGYGMDADVQGRIFDSFYSTKGSEGTGLGLAVAMRMVQNHGGSICVESAEGVGTTFTVSVPAVTRP